MSQLSLIVNAKDNIDLHITPIKGGNEVTEATINELIEKSDYSKLRIVSTNIKKCHC